MKITRTHILTGKGRSDRPFLVMMNLLMIIFSMIIGGCGHVGRQGDLPALMKAYRRYGDSLAKSNRYLEAVVSYGNAMVLAEKGGQWLFAAEVAKEKGDMLRLNCQWHDAAVMAQREQKFLKRSLSSSSRSMGKASQALVAEAKRSSLQRQIADGYSAGEIMKALLLSSQLMTMERKTGVDSLCYALMLSETDQPDLAWKYSRVDTVFRNTPLYYTLLANIFTARGDFEGACKAYRQREALGPGSIGSESFPCLAEPSVVDQLEINRKLNEQRVSEAYRNIIFLILPLLLLIGVGCWYLLHSYEKWKKDSEDKISLVEQAYEEMRLKKEKHHSEIVSKLFSSQYALMDEIGNLVSCSRDSSAARKKVADKVDRLLNEMKVGGDQLDEMIRQADEHYGGVYSDLKRDLPNLKDADYKLYLFSLYRLSPLTIALLLGDQKVNAVYDRKRRLKDKIKTLPDVQARRYLSYL